MGMFCSFDYICLMLNWHIVHRLELFTAILLGSIKVPFSEIKRRILEVDEENLNTAIIEQLIRYMPEPEQMKQIASLKDQYQELAEPEQFAVEVKLAINTLINKVRISINASLDWFISVT